MGIKDFTTEELKAELKRRTELVRKKKAEEMKTALRCRNCKHCVPNPKWAMVYICDARTWGKKYQRNYSVKPAMKACELFERKEE